MSLFFRGTVKGLVTLDSEDLLKKIRKYRPEMILLVETQVKSPKISQKIQRQGFVNHFHVPSNGRSGAYDRVGWNFLRKALSSFGFNDHWCNMVMFCVQSASLFYYRNGRPCGYFNPKRGIRQGDPLSPYLFILGMEVLSTHLLKLQQAKLIKGISIGRGVSSIHHLLYADDLVLFGNNELKEVNEMVEALKLFCQASGPAGMGCVLRKYDGGFIAASVDYVPFGTSFLAEALAMRLGLYLAISYGITHINIQSDSQALINCIKGEDRDSPWEAAGIIEDIRQLFSLFENISIIHIYREGNATADTLAQYGISLARHMSWHDRPPDIICKDLFFDCMDEIVFVNGSEKFMIMDDLRIKKISDETGLSLIRQFGIEDISTVEEKVVSVGQAQLKDFLNLSLYCTTPMTNMFQLKQNEINAAIKIKAEPLDVKSQSFDQIMRDAIAKISLKLVVSISQKKVLYAIANEEFVDLIFSPLAFSIETMAEFFGGYSSIGSMDNLIKSEEILCNEDPGNYKRSERIPFNPKFDGGFIKGPAYFLVTDELVVEPFSPISSISYINKMGVPLSDLQEQKANVGEHEALSILKASLTSKSALTDVFCRKK
ncbi:hypothetical protein IFM89_002648 [Coptis chinensis]|uniref:Reverse transcriptase domain-containing protein n=1 Tax=Coptis chinensis TaxID=261450 RepID=A0A835IJ13_9MAGN|nr:hypothetical protein IFM89_002648 [Coptis chinensis]